MSKTTNLDEVKSTAKLFLNLTPVPCSIPIFVHHPFITSTALFDADGGFDIFAEPDRFNAWKKQMEKHIDKSANLTRILMMISDNYKLTFF